MCEAVRGLASGLAGRHEEPVGEPLLVEARLARVEEGALVGSQQRASLGAAALVGPAL